MANCIFFHPIDPSQGYCKGNLSIWRVTRQSFHPIDPSQGYCKCQVRSVSHDSALLSSNRPEPRVLQDGKEERPPQLPLAFIQSTRAKGTARPPPPPLEPLLLGFHPIDPSQGYCKRLDRRVVRAAVGAFIQSTRAKGTARATRPYLPEPSSEAFIQSTRAKGTARPGRQGRR